MSELTNLVAKQNEESYQLGKKHGAIEELEKIKAEIEKEREEMASVKDWGRYYGLNMSLEIVDNHIAELKGE